MPKSIKDRYDEAGDVGKIGSQSIASRPVKSSHYIPVYDTDNNKGRVALAGDVLGDNFTEQGTSMAEVVQAASRAPLLRISPDSIEFYGLAEYAAILGTEMANEITLIHGSCSAGDYVVMATRQDTPESVFIIDPRNKSNLRIQGFPHGAYSIGYDDYDWETDYGFKYVGAEITLGQLQARYCNCDAICYSPRTGKCYLEFYGGNGKYISVVELDPVTGTWSGVIMDVTNVAPLSPANGGVIATDDEFLYLATYGVVGARQGAVVYKYNLHVRDADGQLRYEGQVTIPDFYSPHSMAVSDGFLYLCTGIAIADNMIVKIDTAKMTVALAGTLPAYAAITDDMTITETDVWVGTEMGVAGVVKIDKETLEVVQEIMFDSSAMWGTNCFGCWYYAGYVWVAFGGVDVPVFARIDPVTAEVKHALIPGDYPYAGEAYDQFGFNEIVYHEKTGKLFLSLWDCRPPVIVALPIPVEWETGGGEDTLTIEDINHCTHIMTFSRGTLIGYTKRYLAGAGTLENPFEISTPEHLLAINDPAGIYGASCLSSYYVIKNDIDLYGVDWTPIGTYGNPFAGHLDGGNFAIKNLKLVSEAVVNQGLFGAIIGGTVQNLSILNAYLETSNAISCGILCGFIDDATISGMTVTGTSISKTGAAGGLIGLSCDDVGANTISDCVVIVSVIAGGDAGGIVGSITEATEQLTMEHCVATVNLVAEVNAGGLVGQSGNATCKADECRATGIVTLRAAGVCAGGLGGFVSMDAKNCYSLCTVKCEAEDNGAVMGGLFGEIHPYAPAAPNITNCYSAGLVGPTSTGLTGGMISSDDWAPSVIVASFWDTEASNQATSDGGVGHVTSDMKKNGTFTDAGWDTDIWVFSDDGDEYPRLAIETQ